ncbi:MAG: glycosyltransferase, partial [Elusimicrobiales bacterium]|nr:glycosyltransferase [Elusimicrobiales bacterium]
MALYIMVNSLASGGAERQALQLATLLPNDGLLLLEDRRDLDPGVASVTALTPAGAPLRMVSPSIAKTLALKSYARLLAARLGPEDTVVSFMERSNFVNILAARSAGHRAVVCERTTPSGEFSGLRGMLMRPLIRRLYPEAPLVIANSEGAAADLTANFGVAADKLKVVHNGVDTAAARFRSAEPLDDGLKDFFSRPVIAACGRLTPAKAYDGLLRAFALLKDRRPDAALFIAGDGELRTELFRLCASLGLSAAWRDPRRSAGADVFFAGETENPHKYAANAALFTLSSRWEGFPNSLLEALAVGAPCAAADCASGPREIMAPGSSPSGSWPEKGPYGILLPVLDGPAAEAA